MKRKPHLPDPHVHLGLHLLAFAATALLAAAATAAMAQVAPAGNLSLPEALEACRTGNTYQARESCISEAHAAHAARQRGTLPASENYTANALARCNIYRQQEDVLACRARVMGLGEVSGSVTDGGLLRRYEYLVPAQEPDVVPSVQPQQSMGGGPAGTGTVTALPARPAEPVAPLKPILPMSPAFPMFERAN